ncbi:hypothetical protein I553_10747 [Mycobacterium xenopi 4042]|uniref:Uncharacterized protein n=1 Tax=Mycobacterium xenopi 4042 TaxID=1299334 RepID=X8DD78_MYCXE|nr:hypothetical protein I553_10747 [Mycobacterium xenopi 4042]
MRARIGADVGEDQVAGIGIWCGPAGLELLGQCGRVGLAGGGGDQVGDEPRRCGYGVVRVVGVVARVGAYRVLGRGGQLRPVRVGSGAAGGGGGQRG